MKSKEEIVILMNYLEQKRNEAIDNKTESLALAIGSQIHLLKWILEDKK